LSLMHVDDPKSGLLPAIRKGLEYFHKHSVEYPGNIRMLVYPGVPSQKLGAVALLALSHIEVLRRPEALANEAEKKQLETQLEEYLNGIVDAKSKHGFHKYYKEEEGTNYGPTSPFYDGECLLALTKAAKYLGHNKLWPVIKASAEAGYLKNVLPGIEASKREAESLVQKADDKEKLEEAITVMRGYYQWATMAWYELLGMDDPDFEEYGPRMLSYTSSMPANTEKQRPDVNAGHRFEGVIPTFVIAVQLGDSKLEHEFACSIREGIGILNSLQVGHNKAYGLGEPLPKHADVSPAKDVLAQGGMQATRKSPALRIDTAQHSLHAVLMARQLLLQQALI